MNREITIKEIEPLAPFSQESTEIFLTGYWSNKKPLWIEKVSPCRQGCPIGNPIARAFYYASRGDYDMALKVYRQESPFPGVCGRVCYHPCESLCNRNGFDEAINIRGFERFLSDYGRVDIEKERPIKPRKERIAVIGSGPAGLSASYYLARIGYNVTIFEALLYPGGMLRYGIPAYRLPRDVLDREIDYIKALGVEIKTRMRVGQDISLSELKRDYKAIFIAIGTHKGMKLGIDGEDCDGAIEGIGLLRDVNSGIKVDMGRNVIVIGGGNTAIDCARSALRIGGREVTILYRRSRSEMPALAEDVEWAIAEGIRIEYLAAPKRIISKGGRVSKIECIRMELGEADESGRPRPTPVKGSEFILEADTIVSAIGQVPDSGFIKEIGLTPGRGGIINVPSESFSTEIEGVFAGGDSAGVRAFVADAIASGKMAAMAISCYIEGKDIKKELSPYQIGEGPSFSFQHYLDGKEADVDLKNIATYEKINTLCFSHGRRVESPVLIQPDISKNSFDEVIGTIPHDSMKSEIERCFKCGTCTHCDLCFYLCPDISISKDVQNGYRVKRDYCKGCGVCASTCPRNVIEISTGGIR